MGSVYIDSVLSPLKERIKDFQEKVEKSHVDSIEKNAGLMERLKSLETVGLRMSAEADKLTKALKGESKTRGNWGEVMLERILEESGLRKDVEYYAQGVGIDTKDDEGKRQRPDIVVRLPEEKHLIIDSKVALIAYEAHAGADSEEDKQKFASDLVSAVQAHVRELSDKHYHAGSGVSSPDFVLMFMPIEASFSLALQTDSSLFQFAWDRRVMIVTPTTLMATLWTIASVWRQENQVKYALEIARQGGALYDKFVGFVDTLKGVGKSISKSHDTYETALNQLSTGRGNLVSRVERLRKMGVNASKKLDHDLLEDRDEDDVEEEQI